MSKLTPCAHCAEREREPRTSMDAGRAVKCPACEELVCPSCRALSGPTVCGSFADGNENAAEIHESEQGNRKARLHRIDAWKRATHPNISGDRYPLGFYGRVTADAPG